MSSNNTISWSVTYKILRPNTDLFPPQTRICIANHVGTPRWFMSVFLLKSDGSTLQSIFFNVFIILKCSINRQNNLWHIKSPRFTPGSGSCSVPCLELGFSNFAYLVNICKVGKVRQSRNLLDPFTAHSYDTACWWAKWDEARLWCGTDWVSLVSMTHVYCAKNSIWSNQSQGFPSGSRN